eukprot:5470850-Pleurochrysis_carterae.AAC.4
MPKPGLQTRLEERHARCRYYDGVYTGTVSVPPSPRRQRSAPRANRGRNNDRANQGTAALAAASDPFDYAANNMLDSEL